LEDLDVDGRIILKWILKEYDERAMSEFSLLRVGRNGGIL
jgi:hypothetical protein